MIKISIGKNSSWTGFKRELKNAATFNNPHQPVCQQWKNSKHQGSDYIFSCDNIIYDCYIYLYFTLKNALKLFKYKIEFKEFRIGNFKGLANAFDKILNHSYNIKQKLFLKKINQSFLVTTIFNSSGDTISTFQVMKSPAFNSRMLAISFGILDFKVTDFELALCTLVTAFNMIIPPSLYLVTNILDSLIIKNYLKLIKISL